MFRWTVLHTKLRLNVGIVSEYYYPLLGGISENVHHTAVELQKLGHRVTVITSNPPKSRRVPPPAGGPRTIRLGRAVNYAGNGAEATATFGGLPLFFTMRQLLRRERFDIVQLHSPLNFTLPAMALLTGPMPRVGTFHSWFEHSRFYSAFRGPLQRQFLGRMSGVSVVSPSVDSALSRYFDLNARVIPNGVDVDTFHPSVPRLERFDTSKKNLLFLGRFDPRNGLPFMLRTFARIRQNRDDVRLIVVGGGRNIDALRALVPRAIRDDVHFEGPSLCDRPRYYATADVFCSPVSKASFGITLLEAMATGKPIVAFDNVGYRGVLGQDEGTLVPHTEEHFASAVRDLLADDARRHAMGVAGRQKALTYAWPAITAMLVSFFTEVLSRR